MSGDVVEWITAEAACERLGKSSKTLERLVITNEIQTKLEPLAGRKPRRLFYAPAIERLADEKEVRKLARIESLTTSRTTAPPKDAGGGGERDPIRVAVLALLERLAQGSRLLPGETTPKPVADAPVPLWLKLGAAASYSGLAQADLKELAAANQIRTRRSGRSLLFQRHSLEEFSRK